MRVPAESANAIGACSCLDRQAAWCSMAIPRLQSDAAISRPYGSLPACSSCDHHAAGGSGPTGADTLRAAARWAAARVPTRVAMAVQIERYRFTTAEYHRLAEAGILGEDDRVELIDGELIAMNPIGPR